MSIGVTHYRSQSNEHAPWVEADRNWFNQHKTRDWYIRDPFEHEIDELRLKGAQVLIDALREFALSPEAPDRTRMRICVFRISDGNPPDTPAMRIRMPTLGCTTSDKENVRLIRAMEYGRPQWTNAKKMLQILRERASGELMVETPLAAEHCAYCRRDFTSPFVHALVDISDGRGVYPTCIDCVPGMVQRHGKIAVMGFAVWVSNDEEDFEAVKKAVLIAKQLNETAVDPAKRGN